MKHSHLFSRRDFMKTAGAVAMGSLIIPSGQRVAASDMSFQMPTRPLGKTGINAPLLAMGGSLHLPMLMLRQAFKWGVTYWDTAHSYMGGNSELRIGKYLTKYPQDRPQIFLVTKSHARNLKGLEADLDESLERLQTDYVDLFFVHSVSRVDELDDATQSWSKNKKKQGKIRLFGFSTHRNMEACLLGASKLGWIDAIMMSYNFRLMHTDGMRRAVDACAEAGIGLTAMKTQGGWSIKATAISEDKMVDRLLRKGFTEAQAKLKAVWENSQIASICSEMPNMNILMENVSAALNRTQLSVGDRQRLRRYAYETRSAYCMGCTRICEATLDDEVPIGDIMRYLMYWQSYGDHQRAVNCFKKIPARRRIKIATSDYSPAERLCPQQMAIGHLMRTALREFPA